MRAWFNGRTGASQASNTSSILVVRSFFIKLRKTMINDNRGQFSRGMKGTVPELSHNKKVSITLSGRRCFRLMDRFIHIL